MKTRVTVSVDAKLIKYAKSQGYGNMSALVEEALREKLGRLLLEKRLSENWDHMSDCLVRNHVPVGGAMCTCGGGE